MGRAARERAMTHIMKAQWSGGCARGDDGTPCGTCKHPPKMRDGDTLDFERAGWTKEEEKRREGTSLAEKVAAVVGVVMVVGLALTKCCA